VNRLNVVFSAIYSYIRHMNSSIPGNTRAIRLAVLSQLPRSDSRCKIGRNGVDCKEVKLHNI